MADEVAQVAGAAATPGRGGKSKLFAIMIVAGLMLIEGVGVYSLVKFTGGTPAASEAAQGGGKTEPGQPIELPKDLEAEVEVLECRPSNRTVGKLITFHLKVSVLVRRENQEQVQKLVEEKKGRLQDRVNYVIRSAQLKHLNEPGLETIRRQIKHEFDSIFGDDELIVAVLIPQMLQSTP